ncbi:MAG: TlyA family RNA methyltransferase [Kordiimonadaceae bacterium]|nr:TlyA family RNA methyltransferase [Kordiimonadaceae bacterium]
MAAKIRADVALVDRGLVESRTRAQALIMAGIVFSGEAKVTKAGQQIKIDQPLEVRGKDHNWVSRGGLKLEKGLKEFGVDPTGFTAIDVGSSTGGFTDVLLQGGAEHVFAVDVGRAQLAWKLRNDDRVTVLEKTNARYLTDVEITCPVDIVVCDASFISLRTVLSAAMNFVKDNGRLIALIKPQFEVGKGNVGKGGVVRDPALHQAVCDDIEAWLNAMPGWQAKGITESPIKGPEGNIEFLIYGIKSGVESAEACDVETN